MAAHSRAKIELNTQRDVNDLVTMLNSDGTTDKYVLVNFDETLTVDARSLLGVIYAMAEFGDKFIINTTHDGVYPIGIDKFRD